MDFDCSRRLGGDCIDCRFTTRTHRSGGNRKVKKIKENTHGSSLS